MAAPTPTIRQTPTGAKPKNGHQTLITFAEDPDIEIWEVGIKPPGQDIGDGIDQTTMHNETYRTSAPRSLITVTNGSVKCRYNPASRAAIAAQLGVEQEITLTYPNGLREAFWGYLKSWNPGELVEGNPPEADAEFVVTNVDPSDGSESGPAWNLDATGTA